jgi:hypothetical protein
MKTKRLTSSFLHGSVFVFRASVAVAILLPQSAAALESRSYVVGWFSHATNSVDDDCGPGGPNPGVQEQYLKNLADLGYSAEEIEELVKPQDDDGPNRMKEIIRTRGRINGQPVNPYTYPSTVVDPNWKALTGKYAYGFNLDGKGEESPHAFIRPDTLETGIDHELYRALGCYRSMRGSLEGRPTYWDWAWGQLKDSQPAWLMTISGNDLEQDGEVIITFNRALEHLKSNIDGTPRADVTYRIDPDLRSHNELRGQLRSGVITAVDQDDFRMFLNPLTLSEVRLKKTQLELRLKSDDSIDGFIGGYEPWSDLYFAFASGGSGIEACVVGDVPGLYYLLKRHADAFPHPETGQNEAISAAYYLEAVSAFAVPARAVEADFVARDR